MTQDEQPVNIDPANIMHQIRRRVLEEVSRRRAQQGLQQSAEAEDAQIRSLLQSMADVSIGSPWEGRHLATSYPYPLKRLALKIRRIIQGEIRWTLEPFIEEQRRLNASITSVIRSMWEFLQIQGDAVRQLTAEVSDLPSTDLLRSTHRHVAFEEEARGSSSLISSRQAIYVDHFRGRRNVLDVGCGRGEFLQLLKENGVDAYGIDRDPDMVKVARPHGLRVIEADAVEHLRGLEDQTLGGLFCSQVIEHMNARKVFEFINLAYRKLMLGSKIVIESVNPTSIRALTEFYRDPTHVRPIHPSTLKFLLECVGFTSVKIEYCNEPPQSEQLESIEETGTDIARINRNFRKLNALLWGPMDYAAIGIR